VHSEVLQFIFARITNPGKDFCRLPQKKTINLVTRHSTNIYGLNFYNHEMQCSTHNVVLLIAAALFHSDSWALLVSIVVVCFVIIGRHAGRHAQHVKTIKRWSVIDVQWCVTKEAAYRPRTHGNSWWFS